MNQCFKCGRQNSDWRKRCLRCGGMTQMGFKPCKNVSGRYSIGMQTGPMYLTPVHTDLILVCELHKGHEGNHQMEVNGRKINWRWDKRKTCYFS